MPRHGAQGQRPLYPALPALLAQVVRPAQVVQPVQLVQPTQQSRAAQRM